MEHQGIVITPPLKMVGVGLFVLAAAIGLLGVLAVRRK